jgi:hypothetical protein
MVNGLHFQTASKDRYLGVRVGVGCGVALKVGHRYAEMRPRVKNSHR